MSQADSNLMGAPLRQLPRWHVITILVAFPIAFWLNSFTPWSYGLFVQRDHRFLIPFYLSVCVLNWAALATTLLFVRGARASLREIGLHLNVRKVVTFLLVVVTVGGLLVAVRYHWPLNDHRPEDWRGLYPFTLAERCFFIFVSLTAGICEEVVYRGFAITSLRQRGWRTWQAVLLATLSFVFIHGIAAVATFPFLFLAGLIFAAIFLWRKSLTPGIYAHTLFDLLAILAV